jgi:hypothetical protein
VQDGEEADFSPEVPGVGGNFEHGLSGGAEEKIVEQPRVPLTERVQLVGQGKDDVEVRYVEQVLFAACEPTVACLRIWDSAGCDRSYRRWPDGHNLSRRPNGLRGRPCGMR